VDTHKHWCFADEYQHWRDDPGLDLTGLIVGLASSTPSWIYRTGKVCWVKSVKTARVK
jgi:hypothetical protein